VNLITVFSRPTVGQIDQSWSEAKMSILYCILLKVKERKEE